MTYAAGDRSDRLDAAFPAAAAIALALLRRPEIEAGWTRPSALPQMSVGALACHLGRQTTRAAELLVVPGELPELASVDEHYRRAAWVTATSPDDPANDRSTDDADAALGPAALIERAAAALGTVEELLRQGAAHDVVPVPWQGWSLRRDDFLLTRLLEVVVHSDDLAVSVGVPTPDFPDEAFAPVCALLARLAVRRHGQAAVVSTLARAERTRPISAF